MPDDLRLQLRRIARRPTVTPDPQDAWSRVLARRRSRRALAASSLAAVAFVLAPWISDQLERPTIPEVAAVAGQGSDSPTPPGQGPVHRLDRRRIDGYGVELLVPASWALEQGDPTTWRGSDGSLTVRADHTPFSPVGASGVQQACLDVAERLPDGVRRRPVEELTVSGQAACLVQTVDGTGFVAVLRFPPSPDTSGHSSALLLVGGGIDGRAILTSVRFASDAGGSCGELAPGEDPAGCQTSP